MRNFSLPLCGRDPIRARIEKWIEAFAKGYRQNMGLLGHSGLGKTRLLSEIFQELSAPSSTMIPVYVDARTLDFEHFIDRWLGALLSGTFRSYQKVPPADFQSLITEAAAFIPQTVERIRHFKKMTRREKPGTVLKELFSFPERLHGETGRKVIMMIDEFDALSALPVSDPFAALGREIMVEKNVLYLAASSNPLKAHEIFREKLTLLFGNFEIMEFGRLGFEEAVRFFEDRISGKKLTASQKRFLIRMTDGHPFYLELLAGRMESFFAQSGGSLVSHELIFEIFSRELLDSNGRISLLFEQKLQKCTLAKDAASSVRSLFALSQGRRRVLAIAAFIGRKVEETKKILQKLVQEDFVSKRGAFYLIEDPLLRFWLTEVYQKRSQAYLPGAQGLRESLYEALTREFDAVEREEKMDVTARVESLFKEFRNDVLELGEKKIKCPQFSEIAFRPTNGRVFPVFAKSPKARWFCQIAKQAVHEEDVASFLEELKKSRKNVQRKVMITLQGIDQNAKLMAQQANIQLWGLRNFNALLELYNLPKVILLSEREEDGPSLGALAQSLHSA